MNGSQRSSCFNHEAKRIGISFYYCLIFVLALIGNIFIGIIVYRTKSMQKPINFFILNMAMSDLLFPIVCFPYIVTEMNCGYYILGGPVGQALCKLNYFLVDVSASLSIQSLVLIAVDRFGAVVFPLRSPLISSKHCRFFILATWIIAVAANIPDALTYELVEYQEGLVCVHKRNEVFGESLSYRNYEVSMLVIFWYVPMVLISILYMTVATKISEHSGRGIGQRKRTTVAQTEKCAEDVNCHRVNVHSMLAAHYNLVVPCPLCSRQHYDGILRLPIFRSYCFPSGSF